MRRLKKPLDLPDIKALLKQGYSIKQVAKAYECSTGTIYRHCYDAVPHRLTTVLKPEHYRDRGVLSPPVNHELAKKLLEAEVNVGDVADALGCSVTYLNRHFRELGDANRAKEDARREAQRAEGKLRLKQILLTFPYEKFTPALEKAS